MATLVKSSTSLVTVPLQSSVKLKIKWRANKQKVDISTIDDVLAKSKDQLTNKSVIELTDELFKNNKFVKLINYFKANNITFNTTSIPTSEKHKLGDILSPEEVQRLLDTDHCINIAQNMDPHLLSPIYIVRLKGTTLLLCIDSMHTLTVVAAFAREGLWGNIPAEWLDFEYPCWVIETDQESFTSLAALHQNGTGKKPWGQYDYHRVHVRAFRFYGDHGPNGIYKLASDKQYHCVNESTIPLPQNHKHVGRAGTLSHIQALSSYTEDEMDEFKFVISMNNKYWHGSQVDSAAFGFYGNLYIGLLNNNIPMKGKGFDKFMDDIHAITKTFFVSFSELRSITAETYKAWMKIQGKDVKAPPFNCALALILKIYKKLQGTHLVTGDAGMFLFYPTPHIVHDIYDSLPLSIRHQVSNSEL